jgi:multiple sugar transport system ATP-binding protein
MSNVLLKNVVKNYNPGKARDVLRGINLDIKEGEFIVFVGPSGCGKSTLLRTIAGLDDITDGELYIGDEYMNDVPPVERGVGMVFQSYALYPHMDVRTNMGFGLKLKKMDKTQIAERVDPTAELLGLTKFLDRKPKALSGGQRQRVAIGRCLVQQPKVFLLDEPLSNLDASLRVKMRMEIAKLHEKLGATMIYVTHDQVEAMTLADRIVVLSPLGPGATTNLEQVGAPLELYRTPVNRFVAGFIGSPKMNFLTGMLDEIGEKSCIVKLDTGSRIKVSADASRSKPGDQVELGLRPEHTVMLDHPQADSTITGTVKLAEHLGSESFIHLEVGCVPFTVRVRPGTPAKADSQFDIGVPADACYLFDEEGKAYKRTKIFVRKD